MLFCIMAPYLFSLTPMDFQEFASTVQSMIRPTEPIIDLPAAIAAKQQHQTTPPLSTHKRDHTTILQEAKAWLQTQFDQEHGAALHTLRTAEAECSQLQQEIHSIEEQLHQLHHTLQNAMHRLQEAEERHMQARRTLDTATAALEEKIQHLEQIFTPGTSA